MNQRKIGAILSYIHIIVTNTISLVYTPYMLNMLGQSEYGLLGTANSVISYLSVLQLGIGGAYIKFNAQARATGNKEDERRLNGMFLTIFICLAGAVLICGMIFVSLIETLVDKTFTNQEIFKVRVIMIILILNMMVTFVCNVFMMALQAYEKFLIVRLILLIAGIVQPLINVIALNCGGQAISITAASLIVSVLSYIAMFVYAKKEIQFEVSFRDFEKQRLKEIFIFSGFLFLNSLTDQITFSTDNIVLSAVKGTRAVAVYSVGALFKNYFQNFATAISSVFSAQINHIVANKEDNLLLNRIFLKVGRIQFYVISLMIIGYCSIGKQFILLWAGSDYEDAYLIGLLLMISIAIPSFQNISIEIQKAKNLHKTRSVIYFLIAIVNVAMTIPFCIKWGGVGAAAATAVCMIMGYTVFMNVYNYICVGLDIISFWKSIFSILPGYIPPIILGFVINKFCYLDSFVQILLYAIVIGSVFIASIWLFSMNEYEKALIQKPFEKLRKRKKYGNE